MKSILRALKQRIAPKNQTKEERRHAMVGPAKAWKMKRDFQIEFLKEKGLTPDHYCLDIGCGTLRGGIPLINYLEKGHYFGTEVREEVLDEGRKELQEAGLQEKNPTLLSFTDISQLTIDQKFDYLWAFSVLIHMKDSILNGTIEFVSKHLSDNGALFANVNIGETSESSWQGFPVVTRPLDFYVEVCSRYGLALADIGSLKENGHVSNVEAQDKQRMLRIAKG